MMSTTPQTTLAKSAAMGRPMSPDLSIYQPQITSVMSGLYRITSIIFAGTFVLSINYFGLTGAHVQKTVNELKSLDVSPAVWTTAKAAIALPITYHFWNGLRHLVRTPFFVPLSPGGLPLPMGRSRAPPRPAPPPVN